MPVFRDYEKVGCIYFQIINMRGVRFFPQVAGLLYAHKFFVGWDRLAARIPKCPKIVQLSDPTNPTRNNIKIDKNHIFKSYVHRA